MLSDTVTWAQYQHLDHKLCLALRRQYILHDVVLHIASRLREGDAQRDMQLLQLAEAALKRIEEVQ